MKPIRRETLGQCTRLGITVLLLIATLASSRSVSVLADRLRQRPQPTPEPIKVEEPLTDMAPAPPLIEVTEREHPAMRLQALGLEQDPPISPDGQGLPPGWTREELTHPSLSTQALTVPDDAPPVPPNPFETPLLRVNPERGKQAAEPGPAWMDLPPQEIQPVATPGR